MAERTPLYPFSRKDSQRLGEHEKWLDSYQANCACARSIELAIKDAYAANRLNAECARTIIEKYGFDRVNWVLAHTIQHGDNDTRFAQEQHLWAKEFNIPYDDHYLQRNFTVGLHPTLVSTFAGFVCKLWKDLGLYDESHCYSESNAPLDYTGKVVVIRPRALSDESKAPENQLFYARGGNGCRPLALGTTVFGEFLKNGIKKDFLRAEIIGVLKLDLLPEWAQQRYLHIIAQDGQNEEIGKGEPK